MIPNLGVILGIERSLYRDYAGIAEKNMKTNTEGLGSRVQGLVA